MKERPILFSGPMVRAILDGRKTQTRRVVKVASRDLIYDLITAWKDGPKPFNAGEYLHVPFRHKDEDWSHGTSERVFCSHGHPGDRLWVKETFAIDHFDYLGSLKDLPPVTEHLYYRADGDDLCGQIPECDCSDGCIPWRPSIFMPRWASRITLEITGIRVERLQDISHDDALAEGISVPKNLTEAFERGEYLSHRNRYFQLWDSINGPGSWAANPWVWVIEFKRMEGKG